MLVTKQPMAKRAQCLPAQNQKIWILLFPVVLFANTFRIWKSQVRKTENETFVSAQTHRDTPRIGPEKGPLERRKMVDNCLLRPKEMVSRRPEWISLVLTHFKKNEEGFATTATWLRQRHDMGGIIISQVFKNFFFKCGPKIGRLLWHVNALNAYFCCRKTCRKKDFLTW